METLTLPSRRLDNLREVLSKGQTLVMEELWDAPKALILATAHEVTGKNLLVLTGASKEESRLYHDLKTFTSASVYDFPAWETLPGEEIPPSPDIVGERYRILGQLQRSSEPAIVLSNLQACLQRVIPADALDKLDFSVRIGEELPFELLTDQFVEMGYQRCDVASDKGEFAVRGGIIDIFPVALPEPYRIEFWGDEVESIRMYDPVSQKSVGKCDDIHVTPAQELELLTDFTTTASILDYLGPNTLVVFDDLLALEDRYVSFLQVPDSPSFSTLQTLIKEIGDRQKLYWTQQPLEELSSVQVTSGQDTNRYAESAGVHGVEFEIFQRKLVADRWNHPFQKVADYLRPIDMDPKEDLSGHEILSALSLAPRSAEVRFLCANASDERHLKIQINDLQVQLPDDSIYLQGYLSSGFALPSADILYLPLAEITGRYKIRRQKQRSTYHAAPSEVFELTPGDNVVHIQHGIGKFLSIETKPNHEGIKTEFFLIGYAKGSKLYVPMTQSHLLTKYVGTQNETVSIHTLGAKRWAQTRIRTEKAIEGYADDLLHMYAQRELKGGYAFPEDGRELERFQADFPFIESEDQQLAIDATLEDMRSEKCMDRIVCGDVGFGKTEVAMRAALKAVMEGKKQVAILVPTTVLAMQHGETFSERMANYPIRIVVLSRFLKPKQTREALEQIAQGSVDIIIGTHRLLSKDIIYKNLGLIVIDEEQRFGVRAKEHLKKVKVGVDCLTLSATPIPRTLYMALLGARDMSTIATPPQDRLPIKTIIAEREEGLIKRALMRELARDGQVFVVHNRVETIHEMATHIQKLVPQARVITGHGQMSADELDQVFHLFKSGEADVLVATTIIESGIDIPNANTMIVDRADRFGLADLYQIRGRVGRWNRQAFAYFLTPKRRIVPEIAQKRLDALVDASRGVGGGMKIAMHDLEIRGAGDILGVEQSGQVAAVGFHLYCKLLKRRVDTLRGKMPAMLADTKVEFPVDARLPEEYVNAPSLRMEVYQRLGETTNWEEITEIWDELKDRYGPPPEPAKWLYHITRVRVFASRHNFLLVKGLRATLTVERKMGKKNITKELRLPQIKSPADLEEKVIPLLKSGFGIK